ncbi:MAG: polysaccharide biosynthesis protein, partial [Actinomycetota bacterium]|nr:polysaccharide biosynthesis protein [Actinomycetota bacterium]
MIALAGVPANIEFVGLRPGEKLHEVLVSEAERLVPTGREKILRVERTSVPDERFAERVSALLGAADAADDIAIRALLALEADGGAPSQEV